MKFVLYNVASKKEAWFTEATQVYFDKIKAFYSFEIIELKPSKNSRAQKEQKLKDESENLLGHLKPNDFVILLDEKGEQLDSIKFAHKLQKAVDSSKPRICFIIGGAFGVAEEVKQRANMKLCLSNMTMNHLVAQTMFLEQLYRALTILKNIPYHNE